MQAKDLFSKQSATYAQYRPGYPQELFEYILQFVLEKNLAWDCATGNGQAAQLLASHFSFVDASDISQAQISRAIQKENIRYHICPAEATPFGDNSFDLITIATAYHWLNWEKFHVEATRVGKNGCVVAAWAYHLLQSDDPAINTLINHFYLDITAPYWDPERKHVDARYASVNFDFDPLPEKEFEMNLKWSKEAFRGFLSSWSAVQHYINKNNHSPLDLIDEVINQSWGDESEKIFRLPLFLKIGRIIK